MQTEVAAVLAEEPLASGMEVIAEANCLLAKGVVATVSTRSNLPVTTTQADAESPLEVGMVTSTTAGLQGRDAKGCFFYSLLIDKKRRGEVATTDGDVPE